MRCYLFSISQTFPEHLLSVSTALSSQGLAMSEVVTILCCHRPPKDRSFHIPAATDACWPLKKGWKAYWHGEFQVQLANGFLVLWLFSRANRVNFIKCWVFRDISEAKKKKKGGTEAKGSAYYFRFSPQSLDSEKIPEYLRYRWNEHNFFPWESRKCQEWNQIAELLASFCPGNPELKR